MCPPEGEEGVRMRRCLLLLLVSLSALTMLACTAAPAQAEGEPWFNHWSVWWESGVNWDGSSYLWLTMGMCANDPLGPENIESITVTDPDGQVYPHPDDIVAGPDYWEDPCGYRIEYAHVFDDPPSLSGT
jgi:hypothetical protein